ncbi:MAG: rhodanese-like domain-containing protein [Acidobacteriota bacterium]
MMLFKRFYDTQLAQASYLIGSIETKQAIVIDANVDIDQYLEAAAQEGLSITHVAETHIHADFVSGSRELAARTGASLYLSDEGDADWKYAFARAARATLLRNGDGFAVGSLHIEALHTPGHTPEHLTFLVTDTTAATEPIGAVTGDFLFAGDVGRPDLLERAARMAGTMDAAARTLFRSLQEFRRFPDSLQIWPGHGAGSACGKDIGAMPQSTLGYERQTNWAFLVSDKDEFVRRVLAGQPDPPRYFAEMKRVNKAGPALAITRFDDRVAAGALVIDTRSAEAYAARHIPGTLNIPLNQSFVTWAGWLLPYDRDLVLIAGDDSGCGEDARRSLALIGLDRVVGCFDSAIFDAWEADGRASAGVPRIDAGSLAAGLADDALAVVDVRSPGEWAAGHIHGAINIPLGDLPDRLNDVPADRPVVVHCQGGTRSAIAASLLQRDTTAMVINLAGGFKEWQAAGQSSERVKAEAAHHQ